MVAAIGYLNECDEYNAGETRQNLSAVCQPPFLSRYHLHYVWDV